MPSDSFGSRGFCRRRVGASFGSRGLAETKVLSEKNVLMGTKFGTAKHGPGFDGAVVHKRTCPDRHRGAVRPSAHITPIPVPFTQIDMSESSTNFRDCGYANQKLSAIAGTCFPRYSRTSKNFRPPALRNWSSRAWKTSARLCDWTPMPYPWPSCPASCATPCAPVLVRWSA